MRSLGTNAPVRAWRRAARQLRATWRYASHLASRRETATTLAAFRILACAITIFCLLDARTVADAIWLRPEDGGMFPVTSRHWLFTLQGGPRPESVSLVQNLALLFASVSLIGLGGRWPLLATGQCYSALTGLNGNASGAYDSLIVVALWTLFLSGSQHTLSLDCYIRNRRWTSRRLVYSFPRYLLIGQVLIMYTFTGLQKVGISWTPLGGYHALYYVLNDPTFTRYGSFTTDYWPAVQVPLLQLGTALSWHWELSAPLMLLALYLRDTRKRGGRLRRWVSRIDPRIPWLGLGVFMHLGILLLLDVGPFSWITLSYYIVFFRPAEWRRIRRTAELRLVPWNASSE